MNKKLKAALLACGMSLAMLGSAVASAADANSLASIAISHSKEIAAVQDAAEVELPKIYLAAKDGAEDAELESKADAKDGKKMDFVTKIHYETKDGSEAVEEIKAQAAAGEKAPWLSEKKASREHGGLGYVLSGASARFRVSEDEKENVANLYYRLDEDKDGKPDALSDSSDAVLYDYKIVRHFSDTEDTDESIARENDLGSIGLDGVVATAIYGEDGGDKYDIEKIDVASIFVGKNEGMNVAHVYYTNGKTAASNGTAGTATGSDPTKCPFDPEKPAWVCTHDHKTMTQEDYKKEIERATGSQAQESKESFCDSCGKPSWLCVETNEQKAANSGKASEGKETLNKDIQEQAEKEN